MELSARCGVGIKDISCWMVNFSFALSFLYGMEVEDMLINIVTLSKALDGGKNVFPGLAPGALTNLFSTIDKRGNGLNFNLLINDSKHWEAFIVTFGKGDYPVEFEQAILNNDLLARIQGYLEKKETCVFLVPVNILYEDGSFPGHLSLFICHDGRLMCADFQDKPFSLSVEDIRSRMLFDAHNGGGAQAINTQSFGHIFLNFGFPWIAITLPKKPNEAVQF